MIEKNATIALRIAIARNKAGNASPVFDGDLHKFSVAQEAVHAGVIWPGRCRTRPVFVLPIRVRLRAREHQRKEDETRNLQRVQAVGVDRHAHLGTLQYSRHDLSGQNAVTASNPLDVSYNLSTE